MCSYIVFVVVEIQAPVDDDLKGTLMPENDNHANEKGKSKKKMKTINTLACSEDVWEFFFSIFSGDTFDSHIPRLARTRTYSSKRPITPGELIS